VFFNCGDADFQLEAFVEIGRGVFLDDGEIACVVIENLRVIGERPVSMFFREKEWGEEELFKVKEIAEASINAYIY
jgi:hypothetical protein